MLRRSSIHLPAHSRRATRNEMTFTSEIRRGIAFFKFSGRLVFEEPMFAIHPEVRELLESGVRAFIFDFSEVPHCDSSGCGELIGIHVTIRNGDARLAFACLTPRMRVLWERIKLTDVFAIFDTLSEAEDFVQR